MAWTVWCAGNIGEGERNDEIAEAADAFEAPAVTDCGRAVVIPDTGSDLDAGHRPREGFFRVAHDRSPSEAPPICGELIVDVDEVEDREEDEFVRCTPLRGTNMRDTSSGPITFRSIGADDPEAHAFLGRAEDWSDGGDATAVIGSC